MSEVMERCGKLLHLSDRMLRGAKHEDLEECIRLLAVHLAEYREKHDVLSFDGAMDLLSTQTPDAGQAKKLADGLEIIVGILGFMEADKGKS